MTGETILVTRPAGDEKTLTDLLHHHGYRVIHEPLTEIFLRHYERQALENALYDEPDGCIITSRHGVQALAALTEMRDLYLICVGEATARTAFSLGFNRVSTAGGNAAKLSAHITASYDEGSRFLYVSGEHVRLDMARILSAAHMQVQRLALYEAVASTQLSDTLVEQLRRGQVEGVTLLSQRTATIFCELMAKAGLEETIRHLHGFTFSGAIAEPIRHYRWQQLHIAHEATLASLLQSVDNAFQD